MRKLYVYTKEEYLTDFNKQLLTDFWYDLTRKIVDSTDDIHTTNIYGLYGAQDHFDEIYVDGKQLWPDDKKHEDWGNKELRVGHNLCRLIGAWTGFKGDNDNILDSSASILEASK